MAKNILIKCPYLDTHQEIIKNKLNKKIDRQEEDLNSKQQTNQEKKKI